MDGSIANLHILSLGARARKIFIKRIDKLFDITQHIVEIKSRVVDLKEDGQTRRRSDKRCPSS